MISFAKLPIEAEEGLRTPVKKSPAVHFIPEQAPSKQRPRSLSPVLSQKSPSPSLECSESEVESLPNDVREAQLKQSGETVGRPNNSLKLCVHLEDKSITILTGFNCLWSFCFVRFTCASNGCV